MRRAALIGGLAGALALGVALPIVFGDERHDGARHRSAAEVEHLVGSSWSELSGGSGRPVVSCRSRDDRWYECSVRFSDPKSGVISIYDLRAPAYDETSGRSNVHK